ncbi:NADH:flavin oxidoreductase [Tomitella biformata]|uniref:NADH:flavin oxidoreductase n=1 Tax=Tomitella biformata TaxID=630403 RepID=UPI000465D35B|nr:NADH:flavin oxidoreductase [Tomitella biformata]
MTTAERVPAADILAPARLGPVTVRNRIIKAATAEGMTPDGLVTDELIDFHRRLAQGGIGVTTLAGCAVAPDAPSATGQIVLRREAVPGLRRLTDAVHAEGAAASVQINHAGPVADVRANGLPAIAPGKLFSLISLRNSRPATAADIERVTQNFVDAALLAVESGFDVVELHMGHNYFVSSFLSPKLNKRTDGFGGALENRARVARDVARRVRDAVQDKAAIIAKLSMDDGVPGGTWLDEALQTAQWLDQDGSLDALEMTVGSSLYNPMYLFKGEAPVADFAAVMPQPVKLGVQMFGKLALKEYPYRDLYLLEQARQFLPVVKTPLILLGGVTDRAGMDTAMAEGFGFVAIGRALLREPDLINQIAANPGKRSLCVHCNRCMPTVYTGTRCVLTTP